MGRRKCRQNTVGPATASNRREHGWLHGVRSYGFKVSINSCAANGMSSTSDAPTATEYVVAANQPFSADPHQQRGVAAILPQTSTNASKSFVLHSQSSIYTQTGQRSFRNPPLSYPPPVLPRRH